ncbi:DUF4139 domain-containing protein [Geobacter benzoatilyticus]|uniref:DUF4139 domain-containing protein n=1 Tax=Geobacter benzoatilyticus TaxID=2815309 RepID=A0ABX7Q5Z6_9BACT|nr:DUF4139 domain-containing protein [Geobacter benzoatilyticus]QSV46622.1 DUF4139 domain-containing protein [Geobacter benzoatilyticus]
MKRRLLPLLALFALALPLPAGAASTVSTVADQTGIAITIYNQNLGLVKDRRDIRLGAGSGELRFMDVAAQIIPTSVAIAPLSGGELRVLEQNYEYDLLSPQKLMDKYVGKEVKLYQKNPQTEREEVVTATLLSNNDGPVYRIGNEITFGHPGRLIFPGVPDDLIARPTLVWLLESAAADKRSIEASYLTGGISWRADYVATLGEKDDTANLAGWVTIDNHSGTTYRNAALKLVAGDINRAQEQPLRMAKAARFEAMSAPAPQFREESFFEYHLYTLQRPSTIKENQTKQISLVTADAVPVKKEFLLKGENSYYYSQAGDTVKQKVGVFVELENRKEHNLGMPLPKGIVRVYKRDAGGSLQFVGEDTIDHTPEKETVRIKMGDAFDVAAERKQTEWKKIASDTYEAAFEIKLRNHKKEDITVKVVEPVPGDWQMLSSSHPHTKGDAFSAVFQVPVPKDGETTLSYRVRMRY